MKDFKKLREEALRQQQRQQEVFKEGDIVMSSRNGDKGKIHRVGGNYAIVVTEDGKMFREWIKNIRSINNLRRTSFYNNEVSETN
jgi:ribosomal protein L2